MPRNIHPLFFAGLNSITDQAIFSLSNFGLTIFLAASLAPDNFGAFSVVYSIHFLLVALQGGIFIEPMLINASTKFASHAYTYTSQVMFLNFMSSIAVSVLLGIFGLMLWVDGETSLSMALIGFAIAMPFMQSIQIARRRAYALMKPEYANIGSILYLLTLASGLLLGTNFFTINVLTAYLVLAVASAIGSVVLLKALSEKGGKVNKREVVRIHLNYGKWGVTTNLLTWIPSNALYFILPSVAGLASAGALRALMTLTVPVMHINNALATVAIPHLAKHYVEQKRSPNVLFLVLPLCITLIYWAAMAVFGPAVVNYLFDEKYSNYIGVISLIGFLPVSAAFVAFLGSALRARNLIDKITIAYGIGAAVSVLFMLVVIPAMKVEGAVYTLIGSSVLIAMLLVYFLAVSEKRNEI